MKNVQFKTEKWDAMLQIILFFRYSSKIEAFCMEVSNTHIKFNLALLFHPPNWIVGQLSIFIQNLFHSYVFKLKLFNFNSF